jgi:hypothetical protein
MISIRLIVIPWPLLACAGAGVRGATPRVAAGAWHSLALHADGTVRTWGERQRGTASASAERS